MRRLPAIVVLLSLPACQRPPESAPAIVLSTTTPFARTLVTASAPTPRPSPTATPEPLPTPNLAPSLPPDDATPTPAPSAPPGGQLPPTAAPVPTLPPSLALVAEPQPADSWTSGPPLRRPRAGLIAGVVDGQLIAAEGAPRPSVELLAVAFGGTTWRLSDKHDRHLGSGPTLDGGVSLMACGVAPGALFGAGGSSGGPTDVVARYGAAGFVDRVGKLPAPVKAPAGGMLGDTFVVAGGMGADGPVSGVRRMRVREGREEPGADMPVATGGAASAPLEGKLWVIGGYAVGPDGLAVATAVQVYDPATDTWRSSEDGGAGAPPPLPAARHSATAINVGNALFVVGGVDAQGTTLGSVLMLDRAGRGWREVASMPTPRALVGLATYAGKVWAIGGRGADGQATTTVEVYQP